MSLPLWIFTESDRQRGLGHLVRCSAYAAAWKMHGGEVRWVVEGDEAARHLLAQEAVSWRPWQRQAVEADVAAVAIVDSYSASLGVLLSMARHFRRVVYLDDTRRLPYPAGLVVHGAPGPHSAQPGEAQWAWGPSWQPLRPAFWRVPAHAAVADQVARVLVLMGGSDVRNLLPRMAAVARRVFPAAQIHAVLGEACADVPQDCIAHRRLDAQAMCALMQAADLAVSAAGQTSYELARCGVPAVLVGVADNQDEQLREWPRTGAFVAAGHWNERDLDANVAAGLRRLAAAERRLAAAKAGQALVDGGGVARVLAWLAQ